MKKIVNIANAITSSRIVFAILILFSDPFSIVFYVFYLLAGFSDMIDGTIARRLNLVSSFGSKFDSIADFIFITIVLVKICNAIYIPMSIWIWIAIIAIIKIINIISSLVMYHRLVSMHTLMNKITGFMLFLLPMVINIGSWQATSIIVIITGLIASFAAIQEGHYIRSGREIE